MKHLALMVLCSLFYFGWPALADASHPNDSQIDKEANRALPKLLIIRVKPLTDEEDSDETEPTAIPVKNNMEITDDKTAQEAIDQARREGAPEVALQPRDLDEEQPADRPIEIRSLLKALAKVALTDPNVVRWGYSRGVAVGPAGGVHAYSYGYGARYGYYRPRWINGNLVFHAPATYGAWYSGRLHPYYGYGYSYFSRPYRYYYYFYPY